MNALNLARIQAFMREIKEWSLESNAIVKEFRFADFKSSMEFADKVAEISERMNHHPSILIEYGLVRLTITTHSEKGLTEKDFELAKEIDLLHK